MIQVSVVIPSYNREALLTRALDSVFKQSGVVFEVIVVDDGSTDGTRALIEKKFPQVTYLYQSNRGPASARNRGIEASRGEWIAFLDSDDEWLSRKLAAQMDFFESHPDYLAGQTEEIWIRRGRRVNPMKKHKKFGGWIFENCLPLCLISPSAVMIHRKVFDDVGIFDESFPACEDYELWLRLTTRYPVGLIEKPFTVKYGGHSDQRSHAFPAMDLLRIRALAKILNSKILTPNQCEAARKALEQKVRIYTQGALKRGRPEAAGEMEKILQGAPDAAEFKTFP